MKNKYKMLLALITVGQSLCHAQTYYGVGAGTMGQNSSYFGANAGKVSTGPFNTFIGQESGANNQFANDNTFVGYNSGALNSTGIKNTFIGSRAGESNGAGFENVFLGQSAGMANLDGGKNVYLGVQAGAANVAGTSNCFVGAFANYLGAAGDYNTLIGAQAGEANTGSNVVSIGFASGVKNNGNFNVFAGNYAGFNNTTGFENTYLGENAGYSGSTGSHNTYLGSKAGFFNQKGSENVFVGNSSGYNNATGYGNTFVGTLAGESNTTGKRNTYLGYKATGDPMLTNATAVGYSATVQASNSLVLGFKANVGIGVSAPGFQLHLNTDGAAKAGSPDWIVASDIHLKKNITDFTDGLDLLKRIRPVWFQYNGQAGIETGDKKFVGILAQEMQKVAPYTIGTFMHLDSLGNKTEYLDYDANAVTYILINSVKEQQRVIEQKDEELKQINAEVAALSKRLEELERIAASNIAKPLTGSVSGVTLYENKVILEQNAPNGFSGSSSIKYFIPQSVKEATVDIYSVDGVKVNSYPVRDRGEGQLVLSAKDFKNGVFIYDLVTDGRSNGARKMIVQK